MMRPKPHALIFDIDGTLVDSNELHVDAWNRAFRHFGKEFPREALRAQIGKGSDQYLPEFLTPEEIKRFGKELDEYWSEVFRKEYLPKVRLFRKCANFSSAFMTTTNEVCSPVQAKRLTPSITSTCLRSAT